jgi:hypothetical protein
MFLCRPYKVLLLPVSSQKLILRSAALSQVTWVPAGGPIPREICCTPVLLNEIQ